MIEIIPGILEQDWDEIEKKFERIRPFAKTVHIDLLDGIFADNKTFLDPLPFKKYSDYFFLELHMMVKEPIEYLDAWADAGFKRFIGHIEMMSDQNEFIAKAQQRGEVLLALDGKTSPQKITVPIHDLDGLLVMTINAGFSGQTFMPELSEKCIYFRELDPLLPIVVDGGINDSTIKLAQKNGATRYVATSALFSQGDPEENFHKLHKRVTGR